MDVFKGHNLVQRLDRLERENRYLKRVVYVVVVGIVNWYSNRQVRKQASKPIDNNPDPRGNVHGDSLLH